MADSSNSGSTVVILLRLYTVSSSYCTVLLVVLQWCVHGVRGSRGSRRRQYALLSHVLV